MKEYVMGRTWNKKDGKEEYMYVLVGETEGKRSLRRPRCRWVDTMKMGLAGIGRGYLDWIGLGEEREDWRVLVKAGMDLQGPYNVHILEWLHNWQHLK
jgi:hypothetical protein